MNRFCCVVKLPDSRLVLKHICHSQADPELAVLAREVLKEVKSKVQEIGIWWKPAMLTLKNMSKLMYWGKEQKRD